MAPPYTEEELAEAMEYATRCASFPPNYYTGIKTTVGSCFDGVDVDLPPELASAEFTVDFSTRESTRMPPRVIEDALRVAGIKMYRRTDRSRPLEQIRSEYDPKIIVEENKVWWLAHCQALRDGDKANQDFVIDGVKETYSGITVLGNEYHTGLKYFTKDSLYDTAGKKDGISAQPTETGLAGYWDGRKTGTTYENSWWALLSNPRVKMTWPRVAFEGEEVSFDWICFDVNTNEMTAYGDVIFFRCGDVGAAYKKYEHLYFLRDAYKPFFDGYFSSAKTQYEG